MKKIAIILFSVLLIQSCALLDISLPKFNIRQDGIYKIVHRDGSADYYKFEKDWIVSFVKEHKGTDKEAFVKLSDMKAKNRYGDYTSGNFERWEIRLKNLTNGADNTVKINPDGSIYGSTFLVIQNDKIVDKINKNLTEKYLFEGVEGNNLLKEIYNDIIPLSDGKFITVKKDKYGVKNLKGDIILESRFDYISKFKDGYARIKDNDKWGFIDKNYKIVIDCKYDYVKDFTDQIAAVRQGTTWFFINNKGERLSQNSFEEVKYYFYRDFIPVKLSGQPIWSFFNLQTDKISSMKAPYVYIYDQTEHFILADSKKSVIVDGHGKTVLPYFFNDIRPVNKERFIVTANNKTGVMDSNAKVFIPLIFEHIFSYHSKKRLGLQREPSYYNSEYEDIMNKRNITDFVDRTDYRTKYLDGLTFYVKENSKYGVVNDKAKLIVPVKYNRITQYGKYLFKLDNTRLGPKGVEYKQELYNSDLRKTVFEAELIKRISEEYSYFLINDKSGAKSKKFKFLKQKKAGMVDSTGKIVLEPVYRDIKKGRDNEFIVLDEKYGILNIENNKMIEDGYDYIFFNNGAYLMLKNGDSYILKNNKKTIIENCKVLDLFNDSLILVYGKVVKFTAKKGAININSKKLILPVVYDSITYNDKYNYLIAEKNYVLKKTDKTKK